ncbi:MAG: tRNA pseudouridine(38-40) synthase TruA [Capnocytophaga sp.]|nr:tRNA pseudouridine(38-40) synthase TruA [Capnocytophaga sp.]
MRYFAEFSYHGKKYHGWQNQPNAITVQQVLEQSLTTLLRQPIEVVGAGRTDSGVHARQMFAHFDYDGVMPARLVFRLNSLLPNDIAIRRILRVGDEAHARFDAIRRTYEYHISTRKSPFLHGMSMYLTHPLAVDAMNEAAKILFKYTDFQCFSKSNTDVKTYFCTIYQAFWKIEEGHLVFTISADRFLRNMVRAIVGTLLEVGLGKLSLADFERIIESKNRSNAGASVPACGLFLVEVAYEAIFLEEIF